MNQYRVDVIVPIFNVEKYLRKCVDSILSQSYENIMVYLVNDGSTDKSGDICQKYAEECQTVQVIHKKNEGLVSAWKSGVEKSSADWIVFVDGDDWIEKKHIESLVKSQINNDADVVVARMKQINKNSTYYINFELPSGCYNGEKLYKKMYPYMLNIGKFEKRGVPFSRCSKLIRKKILLTNLKYSYEKATYEEDFNIVAPILMDSNCICLIEDDDSAYCYRRIETSMLHGYDSNMCNSIEHVYSLLWKACEDKGKTIFIKQIKYEYISAMIRCATNELQNSKGFKIAKKNIKKISETSNLKDVWQSSKNLEIPKKYRIIVKILENYTWINQNIILRVIWKLNKFVRKSNEEIM